MLSRIDEIHTKIKDLNEELKKIQNQCNHPEAARKSVGKGSTGNYDPSSDCYWKEHHCTLCDKRWNEELFV